jgi:hypothetical protein
MTRGTFANIRLRNQMAPGTEGGWTTYLPNGEVMSIFDASLKYKETGTPLVVLAGKEYGTGSSRDWLAAPHPDQRNDSAPRQLYSEWTIPGFAFLICPHQNHWVVEPYLSYLHSVYHAPQEVQLLSEDKLLTR